MIVVGGRGTNWGPLIGAAALMLADTVLRDFGELRVAGLSLIILLAMIFLPNGIVGLISNIFYWSPDKKEMEKRISIKDFIKSDRSQYLKRGKWIKKFGDENE